MMRATGCDGVVVGRGCLGRPWLFRDLAEIFAGNEPPNPPNFGEVAEVMLEHARLLSAWMGERLGIRNFRKHATWYTKGFPDSARLRGQLIQIETFDQLKEILGEVDPNLYFPVVAMRVPRGKSGGRQKVALPDGYRDQIGDDTAPGPEAEILTSGG
jgi:tRNA-dihydrouridine synthase